MHRSTVLGFLKALVVPNGLANKFHIYTPLQLKFLDIHNSKSRPYRTVTTVKKSKFSLNYCEERFHNCRRFEAIVAWHLHTWSRHAIQS
mmetsp:Transcript_18433/g.27401  ORF Transcript_18433/g.27401 Transcript_18433/m.27401 type:complete len:89 (-) Transcript_18433:130-396(-)